MKLSNKFSVITSLWSVTTGIPLILSCVYLAVNIDDYGTVFFYLSEVFVVLIAIFYFYHKKRLEKAISNENIEDIYNTPLICGVHTLLNFSVFIFLFLLFISPLTEVTSLQNIFKIGFLLLPVGLIQMSLVYYLSFFLLSDYYRGFENIKFEGLDIVQKILLLIVPTIIFSGFIGYMIAKSYIGLFYLIFPALTTWALIRTIKIPLDSVLTRMQNILSDSTGFSRKDSVISGDEIADIDEIFSRFFEKTISLISRIKDTASNILTQGEAILDGIQRVGSSSMEIDNYVSDILKNKEESESIIGAVRRESEGLSSLSSEMESQVQTLTNSSKESIALANSGEDKSEKGIDKINAFVHKIEEGSKSLEELSSAFEEIKEFNSLMEQISDDTNLLALNASIEATRGEGESKGFSVIAEEIRKLSNDSASYLEKTKENIKRMSNAVSSIVESTEKSISIFEECKTVIQKSTEDLKRISESIGVTTNMAEQISDILKEGFGSLDKIKKSTKKLSTINEKQAETAMYLSKDKNKQVSSIEDTEVRVQTLISLIDKIKESAEIYIE